MDFGIQQFVVMIGGGLCCLAMPVFFGTMVYLATRQNRRQPPGDL